jgi:hypothetical protein
MKLDKGITMEIEDNMALAKAKSITTIGNRKKLNTY